MNDGKKIKYNLLVGILGQLLALVMGILLPKLFITNYGSEVNGLLSSVTNIYACIALIEAGVAAASCQALYKAFADQSRQGISAVLSATNRFYHRSGLIYLCMILIFSVFYPLLIDSNIPYITIVLVILFNGFGNVVNYFFHGKYLILLKADGKNFVRTGLETVTNTLKQILKILLVWLGYNVVLVQFVAMLISFVQMIYITYYVKKHYSWIDLKVEPDTRSISQSKNVLVHEINYLISANVDTVLLTIFRTLETVSVYSLYNLLFGTVNRLLRTVRDAFEFKLADLFHKDRAVFKKAFQAFEVYYITFAFSIFSVVNYFILPFVTTYTKGVEDATYADASLPILFVLINLLSAGRYPSEAMIYITGHFEQTQKSAMIESALNVVVSAVFVQFWGIEGVLLGTVVSSLYRANYLLVYVNSKIVGRRPISSYRCWLVNFAVFLCTLQINQYLVINLDTYVKIFLYCIPYTIATFALYFGVISVCINQAFQTVWGLIYREGISKTVRK